MTDDLDHVILLSADALRADHLSCYGYHRDTSPVLDDLCNESVRFSNAFSVSSHTREAVPGLLTGRYPDIAVDSKYRLATDTIASTLSGHGFKTGGFHSNPFVSRAYGFDRGFDVFDDDLHLGQNRFIALAQRAWDKLRNRHYARAEEINQRSLSWIDSLDGDQPFFLWNHYMDTHGPYEPPGEYRERYHAGDISERHAQSLYQRAIKKPTTITDEERELLIGLYDAEIRYNDEQIGAFLGALRDRDLLERSLLIVTSDHGDAFGEHGYYEHPRFLHDEITHVPLLVRPPGGSTGEFEGSVSTLDVVPTIEQAIGATETRSGESLLQNTDLQRTVYQQARGEGEDRNLRRYAARDSEEVCFCEFDMERESLEVTDCMSDSLREELETYVTQRVDKQASAISTDDGDVDEEIDRRLEALGYRE